VSSVPETSFQRLTNAHVSYIAEHTLPRIEEVFKRLNHRYTKLLYYFGLTGDDAKKTSEFLNSLNRFRIQYTDSLTKLLAEIEKE
jgi:hypothetical protein